MFTLFVLIITLALENSALAVPQNAADNLLFATLIQRCAMPRCTTIALQCGDSSEWEPNKTAECFDGFNNAEIAKKEQLRKTQAEATAAKDRADQERIEQENKKQLNYLNRQREQQKIAAIEQQEIIDKKIRAGEARGYKHITFTDFQLDANTMSLGTKLSIMGIYKVEGKIEYLAESFMPRSPNINIITESATRSTRKRLLECRASGQFCTLNILGYTSKCDTTYMGRHVSTDICLVVDDYQ